jgi:hypothetical protein
MPGLPPADTNDRAQRASRVVPFDNDPNSLWDLAAAGLVTSLEVDERGILSPAPSPDVQLNSTAPAFTRPPTPSPSPTATLLPFQTQRGPFDDDRDDGRRRLGFTTPPPKRPPTSPPPLKRKHARAALGEISNKVLANEIKALEQDNASLQKENAHLKKQCRLQENVIGSFCALELARHERRR